VAPRAPGSLQDVLGAKTSIHISVNAKKETISRDAFEGRCHQVMCMATKSIRYHMSPKRHITKGTLSKPPEPIQMKSGWGINVR